MTQEKDYIYILAVDGTPLMPTLRHKHVRQLLKTKKAKVVRYVPFTIQLLYEGTQVVQPLNINFDGGRKNIGISVLKETGEAVFMSKLETRNKDIPKLMKERKSHRQESRYGERRRRIRRAKKHHTTFQESDTRKRFLPKYEKPITLHYIKNTEAKFHNRKRPKGWLTPTANHLLQTHMNLVNLVSSFLPIQGAGLELNQFDFVKLNNPKVKAWEYGKGRLYQTTLEEAISEEQSHHCLLCKHCIEDYHHIIPQHKNGSNTIDNMVGLCKKHHKLVHTDEETENKVKEKKEGLDKQYGSLNILNQIMPYFCDYLESKFGGNFYISNGKDTAECRRLNNIPKDHHLDAYCVGLSALENYVVDYNCKVYEIKQFKRHYRNKIHVVKERRYYHIEKEIITKTDKNGNTKTMIKKKNKTLVAKNRNKRTEQKEHSLKDYYKMNQQLYGRKKAKGIQANLLVEKSTKLYRNSDTVLPGALFVYKGKAYILTGTSNKGRYYRALGYGTKNFKAKECQIVKQNTGLVFCI